MPEKAARSRFPGAFKGSRSLPIALPSKMQPDRAGVWPDFLSEEGSPPRWDIGGPRAGLSAVPERVRLLLIIFGSLTLDGPPLLSL
jgi:hypothetical protein